MSQSLERIVISRIAAADLGQAADLRGQMAIEHGKNWDADHPGWKNRFVEYFARRMETGISQCFAAYDDGRMVAHAFVSLTEDYHKHVRGVQAGRINAVYVHPDYRRRGIGRKLMDECLSWLKQQGCAVARLNSSDQGRPLYESIGFKTRNEMELTL